MTALSSNAGGHFFNVKVILHSVHIVKCRFYTELVMVKLLTTFLFLFVFFLRSFQVFCINLITLNQKIVINTKPNQYSFHSAIQIIKAIVKHLGQANSVNFNRYWPTHRPSYHLSALFKEFFLRFTTTTKSKMAAPSLVKCDEISVFLDYLIAWHIDNHVITPQVALPSDKASLRVNFDHKR